jgi:biopolymer transport protein ExbD
MAFSATARRETVAEMNITPLVDVMLVLLIIFMVAAPMLSRTLSIDLPRADPTPPPPVETVTLEVLETGELRWAGQKVPLSVLDAAFRLEAGREVPPILEIAAHPEVDYQRVADLMARARRAGLERIAL